jgi:hypothetical protein
MVDDSALASGTGHGDTLTVSSMPLKIGVMGWATGVMTGRVPERADALPRAIARSASIPVRVRETESDAGVFAKRVRALVPIVLTIVSLTACSVMHTPGPLTEQARTARTREQHLALAGRYREYAAHLRAEATRHGELAALWSLRAAGPVGTEASSQLDQERHCRELAEYLSRAAAEADAIAQDQETLGKASREQ